MEWRDQEDEKPSDFGAGPSFSMICWSTDVVCIIAPKALTVTRVEGKLSLEQVDVAVNQS